MDGMNKNDQKQMQHYLDVGKWYDSEKARHDRCGSYEFCAFCDKRQIYPCAKALAYEEEKMNAVKSNGYDSSANAFADNNVNAKPSEQTTSTYNPNFNENNAYNQAAEQNKNCSSTENDRFEVKTETASQKGEKKDALERVMKDIEDDFNGDIAYEHDEHEENDEHEESIGNGYNSEHFFADSYEKTYAGNYGQEGKEAGAVKAVTENTENVYGETKKETNAKEQTAEEQTAEEKTETGNKTEQIKINANGVPEKEKSEKEKSEKDKTEIGEIETDETESSGNELIRVRRLRRSFLSKLIQIEETQEFYEALKNAFLSFNKVKNGISFKYESFRIGRKLLARIAVRGKTVIVFLALDPKQFEGSKYFFEDVSDVKANEKVPMKVKVKSHRGIKYAVELFAMAAKNADSVKGEEKNDSYRFAYRTDEQLLEKNLIRQYYVWVKDKKKLF